MTQFLLGLLVSTPHTTQPAKFQMSPLNTISDFAEMREGASHIQEIPRERQFL